MTPKQTFSFSRLSSWDTCKHAWNRNYNLNDRGETNWFARFGSLAHSIFEKIDLGQLDPKDGYTEWSSRYTAEVLLGEDRHEVDWMDKWKSEADSFFKGFTGGRTKAIWVEKHIVIERPNYIFQGYVDRISQLPNLEYMITDYKCGNVYKGDDLKKKARQLYLYSGGVEKEFQQYPSKLMFFHFRKKAPVVIPFKMEDFEEAWDWADRMVAEIEAYEGNYPMKNNGFFCSAICNFRNTCTKQFEA